MLAPTDLGHRGTLCRTLKYCVGHISGSMYKPGPKSCLTMKGADRVYLCRYITPVSWWSQYVNTGSVTKYVCVYSAYFIYSLRIHVPLRCRYKMLTPQFFREVKKSIETEKKVLRNQTWKEASAGEEKATKTVVLQLREKKKKKGWLVYFSFIVLSQGFCRCGGCPVFWVRGAAVFLADGSAMEESRWRIIAGLIASALRTHPHLLKRDPPGSLLLGRRQHSPLLPFSGYDWCAHLRPPWLPHNPIPHDSEPQRCWARWNNASWNRNGAQDMQSQYKYFNSSYKFGFFAINHVIKTLDILVLHFLKRKLLCFYWLLAPLGWDIQSDRRPPLELPQHINILTKCCLSFTTQSSTLYFGKNTDPNLSRDFAKNLNTTLMSAGHV